MHCASTCGCWCKKRRRILFQRLVGIVLPVTFVYNLLHVEYTLQDHGIPHPTTSRSMSSPMHTWAHAVDSRQGLLDALQSDTITAIETDVIMGFTTAAAGGTKASEKIPIMAHPPNTHSDLSMQHFIEMVKENSSPNSHNNNNTELSSSGTRIITTATATANKVIKLDFKEQETVEPTLKAVVQAQLPTTIFFNADILPGPGRREPGAVTMDAKYFLETCQQYMQHHHQQQQQQQQQQSSSGTTSTTSYAFSLGFKTMFTDSIGYTADDVKAMTFLIDHYELFQTGGGDVGVGVVLALNARLLENSLTQFDSILAHYPQLQLLLWTGKGEPPLAQSIIQTIQDHFEKSGMSQRIGYDCQVREDLKEQN